MQHAVLYRKMAAQLNDFLESIRHRRQEMQLTLAEVSAQTGLSKSYISQLERGVNPSTGRPPTPSQETVACLCRALALAPPPELASASAAQVRPSASAVLRRLASAVSKAEARELQGGGLKAWGRIPLIPGDHALLVSKNRCKIAEQNMLTSFSSDTISGSPAMAIIRADGSIDADLLESLSNRTAPNLSLRVTPWSKGVSQHYSPNRFDRDECLDAFSDDHRSVGAPADRFVVLLTQDASSFISWVKNPDDVLNYEHEWISDMELVFCTTRIAGICYYSIEDLTSLASASSGHALAQLVQSHNQFMFLDDSGYVSDGIEAAGQLISVLRRCSSGSAELATCIERITGTAIEQSLLM